MLGIQTKKSSQAMHVPAAWSGLAVVAISDAGKGYGLYRVKQINARTMVLVHGAISFPVGMHLDIEDFQYQPPNLASFHQRVTVVENNPSGIRLVW
ncbi:MAG: hypothetical protein PHD37_04160 [Gallionellaceae bacterium]|nr:hypothetical protein [Gallionellaceae bacterium]